MGLRKASPLTFKAAGVCDAIDGTNAPPGAMAALANLIPNPRNAQQFVPRPASVQISNFAGFNTPGAGSSLLVIGTKVWGMIASARNAGKDEPFCYDLDAGAFITIANVTAANCPTSPATSGEWSPPSMAQIGKKIMITHPGYTGANKVGWIDLRSFASNSLTGDTHTSTTIDGLSTNPIAAGVQVGDHVTGVNIPANTYVKSLTAAAIVLSQATTGTTAGVALTFASGTPAAPLYGAGDTNTNTLASLPAWVAQFNGRAYYAVGNGVVYSDALNPLQVTLATQALTLGDDMAVTCLVGLPLSTQVSGGIVQSLTAFKLDAPYFQITGDPATNDLRAYQVEGSVGTHASLTAVPTPRGIAYISPEGLRIIQPDTGIPSEPLGAFGTGVAVPFLYAVVRSRMTAAFNKNIYRVAVQDGSIDAEPTVEYWYHFSLNAWTGPHNFPASLIASCYQADTDFVLFPAGVTGKLFESTVSPSAASTYTENGAAMTWMWQTCLLPDNGAGQNNHMVESTFGLALPSTQTLTVQVNDEGGVVLDTITMSGDGTGDAVWGSFTWGAATWGGAIAAFRQWTMTWSNALDFKQAAVIAFGPSVSGLVIGNVIAKVQVTGFQGGHP